MKTVLVHEKPSGAKQAVPAQRRLNLAARVGRWSAAHWKTATFGWLALVLLAFAVGSQVGTKQVDPNTAGPGESGRMDRILDAGFKLPADESVLIQSRSVRAGAPAFDAAVADVVARVSKEAAVQNVRSPLDPANAGQIAKSGRAALVEFEIRGEKKNAGDKLGPVLKSVADAQRAHPAFFVGEFGGASAAKAVSTALAALAPPNSPMKKSGWAACAASTLLRTGLSLSIALVLSPRISNSTSAARPPFAT